MILVCCLQKCGVIENHWMGASENWESKVNKISYSSQVPVLELQEALLKFSMLFKWKKKKKKEIISDVILKVPFSLNTDN